MMNSLTLCGTFSVFQTFTKRLEVLKMKVGPVEMTDSITTSQ